MLQVPLDVLVLLLAVSVPEIVCPSEKLTLSFALVIFLILWAILK
jgi:hypothetical protein